MSEERKDHCFKTNNCGLVFCLIIWIIGAIVMIAIGATCISDAAPFEGNLEWCKPLYNGGGTSVLIVGLLLCCLWCVIIGCATKCTVSCPRKELSETVV